MISAEEIARLYDVPVEAITENWMQEYGVPRLSKALFLVAVSKQRDEWLKDFLANSGR